LSTVGSHLQSGSIDGTIVYTSAESTPVPWLAEASLAVDWATLNPSADEVATLKRKGFPITELKSSVFKRDTHTDKTVLTAIYFGFNMGIDIPEAEVYKMLTIVEKHAGELAKADESFVQVAKDMTGMQRRGIEASAGQVPIHPGLAKYMREKGAWDAKWDGNIAKQ
jgi:TRAP-type uncharacterized transport system substrate-binding protein